MMKKAAFIFILLIIFSSCTKRNNSEIINESKNINKKEIYETSDTKPLNIKKYVNSPEGLRVRNSPEINSDRIGLLGNLTEVLVIKEDGNYITIDGVDGKWTYIVTDNIQGWVFGAYLSIYPVEEHNTWKQIASSVVCVIGIKTDGSLWAWGYNSFGELGDGTTENRLSPVRIGRDNDWYSVSTDGIHAVALKTDGSLWAWGGNGWGQLGDGTEIDRHSPVRIGTDRDWASVSAGDSFTIAIKTDGSLWGWGINTSGQLGNGRTGRDGVTTPVRIGSDNDWVFASAGGRHSLVIKADGSLWIWGDALGMRSEGFNFIKTFTTPTQVGTDTDWATAAAGRDGSSLAIKTDGTLWALGRSLAIIVGSEAANTNGHPRRISEDTDWKFVPSNNYYNSVAMKMDGSLWAWGTLNSNEYDGWGEPLPLVEFNRRSITGILNNNNWATVSANSKNILAVASDGTLWAWGSGPLGDGTTTDHLTPVQIISDISTVSYGWDYPVDNKVSFSLEAIDTRSFKLTVEGAIFNHNIRSLSRHFLDVAGRSDRVLDGSDFEYERNSSTEMTATLLPGVKLFSTVTVAFKPFDFSFAVQGDPLAKKHWTFQTDPDKSSITLR